jgi:hypothetical protein
VNGSDSVGSPPMASREPQDAPRDARGAAIDELARVSLVLATAIAQLDYMSAAWGRRELVAALAQAERLEAPGDGAAPCDDFLRRLAELRTSAEQLLAIAPQPSPATLAATATGDMRAWNEEAQRWSAARTATNAAPLGVPRRRYRRNTRPDSPKALREAPGEAADEAADGEAAPDAPSPSDLEGTR